MSNLRKITLRLTVLLGAFVASVISAGSARAEGCDPLVDEGCTPVLVTNWPPVDPTYAVVYIDDRQFIPLLILTAITTAVTLATFVWRASSGLTLRGRR